MNKILLLLIVFGFTYLYSNVEQPDDDISFNLIVETVIVVMVGMQMALKDYIQ